MNLSLFRKEKKESNIKRKKLLDIFMTLFSTLEIIFIVLFLFCSKMMDSFNVYMFFIILLFIFILFFVFFYFIRVKHKTIFNIIALIITFIILLTFIIYFSFPKNSNYEDVDKNKNSIFSNHKVMIIVPHEDDDINIFGGLYEQYISYGSDVYTVFVTNGDYYNIGEKRINEAIDCMKLCGVPEEKVIFLGYGDNWNEKYPHIYNASENEVIESHAGKTQTYGTELHPAFNESLYTNYNYLNDLEKVILNIRPDIIYCVDKDSHIDHKATSLAFEKVMGRILKEDNTYKPIVLKGFAYKTAWTAKKDFYSRNILSTVEPLIEDNSQYFEWNSRVRLPIKASTISRSILGSKIYKELKCYASQNAIFEAESIINGDKVFWERPTKSLIYNSIIETTSGNSNLLNDFMLSDNNDLKENEVNYSDGIWIPEASDQEKSITIKLSEPTNFNYIYLYDNPSLVDNILNIEISLDNGKSYQTGELNKNGSATICKVEGINVSEIRVKLTEYEGSYAGLSEIEVYDEKPKTSFNFIKIMDEEDNFVYDYITDGEVNLKVYNSTLDSDFSYSHYDAYTDNPKCFITILDDYINVKCPKNEKCIVTVVDKNSQCMDSVLITNKDNFIEIKQENEKRMNTIFYNVLDIVDSLLINKQ